jgi:hypothetical protein
MVAAKATGGEEGHRACVATRCHPSPVPEPPKHDLDAVSAFVAMLVVFHRFAAGLLAWDARLYPFVFQRISEPIGIVATIRCRAQHPFCRRQAAQQICRANVVADLACGHDEVDRAAVFISDSMQFGVRTDPWFAPPFGTLLHNTLSGSDQSTTPPLFPTQGPKPCGCTLR